MIVPSFTLLNRKVSKEVEFATWLPKPFSIKHHQTGAELVIVKAGVCHIDMKVVSISWNNMHDVTLIFFLFT
jgi:hypothetical protein